jgi:hypothetical protein
MREQVMPDSALEKEFKHFVERYLIVQDAKCYRHCQDQAKFVSLQVDKPGILGGYFCPGNYASRVVYFSLDPDREWFEKFLRDQVGDRVRSRDIRSATRHGWELGGNAETEITKICDDGIRQLYWTAYPLTQEEKTSGAFRCENCGKLFVKGFADERKLCDACS